MVFFGVVVVVVLCRLLLFEFGGRQFWAGPVEETQPAVAPRLERPPEFAALAADDVVMRDDLHAARAAAARELHRLPPVSRMRLRDLRRGARRRGRACSSLAKQ